MPELDDLVRALRDEADRLPSLPLLEGVRAQARTRRRRRQGVAGVSVLASVALVASLFAGLGSRTSSTAAHRPPTAAVTNPSALIGPTWYLQSWTSSAGGAAVLPDTDRPPTLVVDSRRAAHIDDPTNTTTYDASVGRGTFTGVRGSTTAVAEDAASQAAFTALDSVLSGSSTWQVTGTSLVMRAPSGATVTFTRDEGIALATGGLYLNIVARAYQPVGIGGSVTVVGPTGSATLHESVGADGRHLSRLAPGTWSVTATVVGGTCTPATVVVTGGTTARAQLACLVAKGNGTLTLAGAAWYLTSWTTAGGKTRTPQVVPPPRLVFDNAARARSTDGCNDTFWTLTIGAGVLDTLRGSTHDDGSTADCEAVHQAVSDVLVGHSTWSVKGSVLTINGPRGGRLTYTRKSPSPVSSH